MSAYKKHVFVCENRRANGERCCDGGGDGIEGGAVRFMRRLLRADGSHGKGRVRINRAGCFDRCQEGPALVVYPHGRWYRYQTAADLEEIIKRDVLSDEVVERLQI